MKETLTRRTVWVIFLAVSLTFGTRTALANFEVSAGVQISAPADFYEPLGANGAWVEVGTYGRCWHPAHVAGEWRPYCDGTWVWTDCGWYWQSDEPWAWACYHYGSWVYDSGFGWVWVPGVEWAPAWVSWRVGGGHIGWAPCAPAGVTVVSTSFVFVEENHFRERHRPSTVIVNNTTIINNTTVINASKHEDRNIGGKQRTVVVNGGPDVNEIAKVSGKKISAVAVTKVDRRTKVPTTVRHMVKKPEAMPEHPSSPAAAPEFPARSMPPDKNLPPEKHELLPPEHPATPETPLAPQPVPSPKRELVPPVHEVVPPHQPPVHQVPPVHPVPQPGEEKGNGQDHGPAPDRDNDKHHE